MDLSDLRGIPKVSGGKLPAARVAAPAREVGVTPTTKAPKSSSKRPSDASTQQADDLARRHKKVKILSRRHKTHYGEGGSRSHSKGKEPATSVEELETPIESAEEVTTPVFHHSKSMKDLCRMKVRKDYAGGVRKGTSASAVGTGTVHAPVGGASSPNPEKRAFELEKELEKTKRERDEALQWLETSNKELNEARGDLSEAQRQLKEAWVRAQKMDDELLKSMKDLESTQAELLRWAIDDYKESVGFKEGLKRMGRVTYEYGYRVALARFRSLHPDSEVEKDPFTIRPEDDYVPMGRQQAFDDSDPPES
ncbi:hypothetical protein B296_00018800 [Ensete ventricosum]|uniref:Uncharacterized protein n=1 Tax=Ensete ventricosum TaxID=4639 RepID=A0A426Y795_ENSVE|nr:hypothetical protein B296_00018800 [Ensete ventricosum]